VRGPVALQEDQVHARSLQRVRVLQTVRSWLQFRESGDAEGAASLCTSDVRVYSPADTIMGRESVKRQVFKFKSPAVRGSSDLMVDSSTVDLPGQFAAGLWVVYAYLIVGKPEDEVGVRIEWRVRCHADDCEAAPLIAEIVTSVLPRK
jgi:hypothetical protein